MPTIRDGRGQLTVHDMGVPPTANPSGPVERVTGDAPAAPPARSVGRERDPELMAESRSRGGQVHAAIVSQAKPTGGAAHHAMKLPRDRDERMAAVLDAVRASTSHLEAGKRLGVSGTRVEQIVSELRRAGQLPEDVETLLRARSGRKARPAPAQADRAWVTAAEAPPASQPEPEPSAPLQPGLPCVSCSHAIVCSIRPELESWHATLERPLSPLVAITIVDARVEVACEHYLAAAS